MVWGSDDCRFSKLVFFVLPVNFAFASQRPQLNAQNSIIKKKKNLKAYRKIPKFSYKWQKIGQKIILQFI
jgi:hypothetical protein